MLVLAEADMFLPFLKGKLPKDSNIVFLGLPYHPLKETCGEEAEVENVKLHTCLSRSFSSTLFEVLEDSYEPFEGNLVDLYSKVKNRYQRGILEELGLYGDQKVMALPSEMFLGTR